MDKLFHFDSPQEVYRADACVISCFDARFDLAVRKFLKRCGIMTYDHVKIAGSVKPLVSPQCEADRDFVLRTIDVSRKLHRPARILVFGHNECGAYGGASVETITGDVLRAAEVLRESQPGLTVECYFVDFDGVYRIQ